MSLLSLPVYECKRNSTVEPRLVTITVNRPINEEYARRSALPIIRQLPKILRSSALIEVRQVSVLIISVFLRSYRVPIRQRLSVIPLESVVIYAMRVLEALVEV